VLAGCSWPFRVGCTARANLTTAAARRPVYAEGDVPPPRPPRAVFAGYPPRRRRATLRHGSLARNARGHGPSQTSSRVPRSPVEEQTHVHDVLEIELGVALAGQGGGGCAERARTGGRRHDAELAKPRPRRPSGPPSVRRGRSPQRAARSSDATARHRIDPLAPAPSKGKRFAGVVSHDGNAEVFDAARRGRCFDAGQRRGLADVAPLAAPRPRFLVRATRDPEAASPTAIPPAVPVEPDASVADLAEARRAPPVRPAARTARSCDRLPGRPEAGRSSGHRSLERLVARACRREHPESEELRFLVLSLRSSPILPASFRQTSTRSCGSSSGTCSSVEARPRQRQAALAGVALLAAVVSLAVTTGRPHSRRVLPRGRLVHRPRRLERRDRVRQAHRVRSGDRAAD